MHSYFEFDDSNMFKKRNYSVASPLLSFCLGTQDTNRCNLESGMLSHSCLISDFSCSAVQGLLCHILHFIVCQTCSVGDKSGIQACQFSCQAVILLWSHAVLLSVQKSNHRTSFHFASGHLLHLLLAHRRRRVAESGSYMVSSLHGRCHLWIYQPTVFTDTGFGLLWEWFLSPCSDVVRVLE